MLVIDAKEQPINEVLDNTDDLVLESSHLSQYFPEDSDETVTFTAGGANNTFGAWAEIVDNNAVTLSSKAAINDLRINGAVIENTSVKDKIYIFEISYGAAKVIIGRGRVAAGNIQLNTTQQGRRKPLSSPAGETIYYRMKCETGGATGQIALRYHLCS